MGFITQGAIPWQLDNCTDTAPWLLALSAGFLGSHLEMGATRRQLAGIKSPTALLGKEKSFWTCLPGDGHLQHV